MRRLGRRGQGSIEVMLIIVVVVALAFVFSNAYLGTQDATTALVIAKNRLTEKLNLLEAPAIIEAAKFTKTGSDALTIKVFTKPAIPQSDLQQYLGGIQTEIRNSTSFSAVEIQINPVPE